MNNENIFTDYPDCVDINDLQRMLNIGRNKAYGLLQSQEIRNKKLGRLYLIPKQSVIDFLGRNN